MQQPRTAPTPRKPRHTIMTSARRKKIPKFIADQIRTRLSCRVSPVHPAVQPNS